MRDDVLGRFNGALWAATLVLAGLGCHNKSPASESPELTQGRELYGRMCAVCHGAQGEGYKADRAPRLAHAEFLGSATDAFLREAIANGRPGTTMTPWGQKAGGPLSPAEVDAVIKLLRSWEHGSHPKLDQRPIQGDATRGAEHYAKLCRACHGERGRGGDYIQLGDPGLLATASDGFLRLAITRGRSGTSMPAFDKTLGAAGIEDVLALLRQWQQTPAPPAASSEPQATAEPPKPPEPIPLGPVPMNPKGPDPRGFKAMPEMTSVEVVKGEYDRHARFAILDARPPPAYKEEHIKGAVSVPFYEPEPYFAKLPKDAWLVCYCACPHAESGQLARKLMDKGFKRVTVLDEGLNVWKARGYPLSTGDKP
jgi:cytochrome c oxidase cbb3-type subunit 3/ubiquinol-cytochrome c reductase cytochrome c subunit